MKAYRYFFFMCLMVATGISISIGKPESALAHKHSLKDLKKKAASIEKKTVKKAVSKTKALAKTAEHAVEEGAHAAEEFLAKELRKVLGSSKAARKLADQAFKAAGFPTTHDMEKTAKCLLPTLKKMHTVEKEAVTGKVALAKKQIQALETDTCIQEIDKFDHACNTPAAILAASAPYIGNGVTKSCSAVAKVKDKKDQIFSYIDTH